MFRHCVQSKCSAAQTKLRTVFENQFVSHNYDKTKTHKTQQIASNLQTAVSVSNQYACRHSFIVVKKNKMQKNKQFK